MTSPTRASALFLSPETPFPAIGGGALRSASLLEYLGRRYDLDVIVFHEPGAPEPTRFIPPRLVREVHTVELPPHFKGPLARASRNALRLLREVPPLNDRFAGFGSTVAKCVAGRHYQLGVIEHFWCAPYWEQVAPVCGRVILDLHNIESELMARYADIAPWPAAAAFRRFERASLKLEQRWLPRFSLLLTASERDSRIVSGVAPQSSVCVYPNAVPFVSAPAAQEEPVVAFSGNLAYRPNSDAVRYFGQRIWPVLRQRWPELIWRVIGKNPEAVRRWTSGDPRIQVTGPVDNAVEALARARVAVVPVRAASGTRVKILEAWAAAKPVVSTSIGAEGLGAVAGEHLLVADTSEHFAEAVSGLLSSRPARERIGLAGRQLLEQEFTWQSAWEKLQVAGI